MSMDLDKELSGFTKLKEEIDRLRSAIIKHRAQKADDRCIEDDDELYAALQDGIKCDRRVGDKLDMLHNCARFIQQRCEGGGWPSYADLEREIARLGGTTTGLTVTEIGGMKCVSDPTVPEGEIHLRDSQTGRLMGRIINIGE